MNDYQKIKTDLKAHIVHTEPVWKRMIKCLRKMMAPQYRTPQTMLSVIVPVYNTGPYLEECLKSIVNNGNLPVTEIICVNDGSTDGSLEILKQFARKYPFITIISQRSGGLSAARNTGLKYANGKYVHFINSDDMIKPGSYRLLFDLLEHNNPDIIYFNEHTTCKKPQPEKGYPNNQPTCGSHLKYNTCISGEECFIRLCTRGSFEELQTGMYITRKSLLDRTGVSFPRGFINADCLFTVETMILADRVIQINDQLYVRRTLENAPAVSRIRFEHSLGYFITYKGLSEFADHQFRNNKTCDILRKKCRQFHELSVSCYRQLDNPEEQKEYLQLDQQLSEQFFTEVVCRK